MFVYLAIRFSVHVLIPRRMFSIKGNLYFYWQTVSMKTVLVLIQVYAVIYFRKFNYISFDMIIGYARLSPSRNCIFAVSFINLSGYATRNGVSLTPVEPLWNTKTLPIRKRWQHVKFAVCCLPVKYITVCNIRPCRKWDGQQFFPILKWKFPIHFVL